ncbi:MAG: hypothetical protein ACO2OX_05545, partial [Candidatus Nanopusillus sp.]
NSDDLVGWSEGTKTVPSLKKLIQDSLQKYPYNIIIPRLEKVSKGYVQMQIYFLNANFDKTRSIIPYAYSSRKYFVFENVDNVYLIKLFDNDPNRNKIVPIFIPHRLYENFIYFPILKTIFPINPNEITYTGGINYAFLFIDDIYPATIIHDINLVSLNFSTTLPGNTRLIDNPIIYFDKGTKKTFVFKNYIGSLINCDINNENNFLKLTTPNTSVNKRVKPFWGTGSYLYRKEYLLRDIELGFRKTFFPIQSEDDSHNYYGKAANIENSLTSDASFYYDLYSPILLINNKKSIEYTKSVINIHELHLTKVNLIALVYTGSYTTVSPLNFEHIPIIFSIIHDGSQFIKQLGLMVEDSVEYISSIQSWESNYDNNRKINFISKITLGGSGAGVIIRIQKDTLSMEVIYGILMIINSIPILYAPYLKLKGDGYFYNVIYNPNDINMVKQRIRYEESKFLPIFYNGYKLLNDQEYTLYGKRYPYNKSFFSFAPFFGYEYTHDGKKYLVPILLREYSIFGYQLSESQFKDWNFKFFNGEYLNNYQDIPDENMLFSVFNLNHITNPNAPDKNLAYRLLGTLVLLVNGDDWEYNASFNAKLPVPAIRGYVEFYKNAATPILEKIDDSI